MTDTNYVRGKYILIKRLKNTRSADPNDWWSITINILNIKIYDENNQIIPLVSKYANPAPVSSSNKVTVTSTYLKSPSWALNYSLTNASQISGNTQFYHSDEPDRAASIIIELAESKNIKLIELVTRPGYDRITNTYIEILDDQQKIKFRTVIRDALFKANSKKIIINTTGINCNSCNDFQDNLNPTTEPRCIQKMDTVNTITRINNIKSKINILTSNMNIIDKLMNDIRTSNVSDLDNFDIKKQEYIIRLDNIINNNINITSKDGTSFKTLNIPDNFIEEFTNYNNNNKFEYKFNDSIASNDVSNYQNSNRDKKLENFANFVQPKINVYERFENDWKNDTTTEPTKFNISYIKPAIKKSNNKIDIDIPFVIKKDFEKNINNNITELLHKKIIYQKDKMNSFWYDVK